MVVYNPKDWWKLIFAFHKNDTFRMLLPGIIGVAAFTALISYVENDFFGATFKNTTVVHTLVGFVLSMLLVFRTNSAYDRWWEARKLWGSLVNVSRDLYIRVNVCIEDAEVKAELKNLIIDFSFALKEHLREGSNLELLSMDSSRFLKENHHHAPLQIINRIYELLSVHIDSSDKHLNNHIMIHQNMNEFSNILGGCERIKKTPIPYSYSLFFKKVIFIYIFTMPIGFVREFGYWASPIVALVFYVFAGIELLAEEIEDPFGHDANDLPTDTICETIKSNLSNL
jgi:putative membrane protein